MCYRLERYLRVVAMHLFETNGFGHRKRREFSIWAFVQPVDENRRKSFFTGE